MTRFLTMRRLTILFFGIFALLVGGVVIVQSFWVEPADKCEDNGGWWYAEGRSCETPVSIAEITGRPIGVSRAEASAEKNRELVAIETRLGNERAARQAAIARDRAALKN